MTKLWSWCIAAGVVWLSGTAHPSSSPDPPRVKDEVVLRSVSGHFVRTLPGTQLVVWSRRNDGLNLLRAYQHTDRGWRLLARGVHHNIVDLQVGDVERRGVDDVVLGLIQRSKLDIVERRRLYVYAIDPTKGFIPKWRGSSLSHPYRAFVLLPEKGGCDLAAIERNTLLEYKTYDWLAVYRWNGFGVRRLWESPVRGHIIRLLPGTGGAFRVERVVDGKREILSLVPVSVARREITYRARVLTR